MTDAPPRELSPDPDRTGTEIQEAARHLAEGRPSDAAALLEGLASRFPAYVTAHVLLARAYEAMGRREAALESWHRAYFLMPRSPLVVRRRYQLMDGLASSEEPASGGRREDAPGGFADPAEPEPEDPALEDEPVAETPWGDPFEERAEEPPEPAHADWRFIEEDDLIEPRDAGRPPDPDESANPPDPPPSPVESPGFDLSDAWVELDEDDHDGDDEAWAVRGQDQDDEHATSEPPTPGGQPARREWPPFELPDEWVELEDHDHDDDDDDDYDDDDDDDGGEDDFLGQSEDLDSLIEQLESAPRIQPEMREAPREVADFEDEVVTVTLARIYEAQGQFAAAAAAYERLAAEQPERAEEFRIKAIEMRRQARH